MNIVQLHPDSWASLNARRVKLPHALLIHGQRGIGKFDLAYTFAKSLLCEKPDQLSSLACGVCPACNWMSQSNHPDFRLLQPEAMMQEDGEGNETDSKKKPSQQITIDQVRGLDDFLHVGTHRHGTRVILVYPAEAMNRSTANSLLKSLEEPVANTVFILVSSESSRLLPTIRSRCQMVSIPLPSQDLAKAWLKQNAVNEAERFLALSGGAPLLAAEIEASDEKKILDGLLDEWRKGSTIDYIAAATNIDKLVKSDKRVTPLKRIVEWLQKWVVDLSMVSNNLPPRYFLSETKSLAQLSGRLNIEDLLAFERKAVQYKLYCEQPLNSRLFLEELFLSYKKLFRN